MARMLRMLPELQLAKTISNLPPGTPLPSLYIYFMLCLFDLTLVGRRLGSGLSSGRANINISSQ